MNIFTAEELPCVLPPLVSFPSLPLEFSLLFVFTVYFVPPIVLSPMYAVAVMSLPFFATFNVSSVAPVLVFSVTVPAEVGSPK